MHQVNAVTDRIVGVSDDCRIFYSVWLYDYRIQCLIQFQNIQYSLLWVWAHPYSNVQSRVASFSTSVYLCVSSDAQSMKTSVQSPLLPSSVNEVSGLMSCANHVSVMMFQPWDSGPKWSQIATHLWLIHKVIGDEGLQPRIDSLCGWNSA